MVCVNCAAKPVKQSDCKTIVELAVAKGLHHWYFPPCYISLFNL